MGLGQTDTGNHPKLLIIIIKLSEYQEYLSVSEAVQALCIRREH